jgi:hypothetical protein
MSYVHDIFISYRRDDETRRWLERHFLPLLGMRVRQELLRVPEVFVDDSIESGVSWPEQLAVELGRSRILVALWAKDYFASGWCVEELATMMIRERHYGFRTRANPRGLIVPAVIHDGDEFPAPLGVIQHFGIQKQFNVRMSREGKRAEKLDEILSLQAAAIAHSIEAAPAWTPSWPTEGTADLKASIGRPAPRQAAVPGFAAAGGV